MKGDLITQMFEEMGIKVVDVTPKAKDWQITGHKYTRMYLTDIGKRIPIEVWSEIKNQDEMNVLHNLQYDRIRFNMTAGNPILKETFSIRNSGGKTYLVTIKE